jgi:hypothetical protein
MAASFAGGRLSSQGPDLSLGARDTRSEPSGNDRILPPGCTPAAAGATESRPPQATSQGLAGSSCQLASITELIVQPGSISSRLMPVLASQSRITRSLAAMIPRPSGAQASPFTAVGSGVSC